MSGRKQHYVPQFILRSFGESSSGKKVQIRVTTRDKSFVVPTDGAAAAREFYSKLDSESETLDDVITHAEAEYSEIFKRLQNARADELIDGHAVSRLLTHLSVRGNYVRQSLATFGGYAVKRLTDTFSNPDNFRALLGIDSSEPTALMQEKFDGMYNERRKELARKRISRFEFRRIAFTMLREKWRDFFDENMPIISLLYRSIDFAALAADGHQKILGKTIEPQEKAEVLSKLNWRVFDLNQPRLALPDCAALAHYSETGVMPLGFVGNSELSGVIFPVSPTRALCGGTYGDPTLFRTLTEGFNTFAAICSWDFVVTPPSYPADWVPSDRIGDAVISMMYSTMEAALAERLTDSALETS